MSLELAHHHSKLAMAAYSWLFMVHQDMIAGCRRLVPRLMCCSCLQMSERVILGDNCCLCSLVGFKQLAELSDEDILFASFRNHICEVQILKQSIQQYHKISVYGFT